MINDSPGGGAGAFREGHLIGSLRGEVADFLAEVGDGSGLGGAERRAGIFFFELRHGVGEERSEGAGVFEVDGLEGEAALLIEEADVAGGKAGGFGGDRL